MKKIKLKIEWYKCLALCEGRHEMPSRVEGSIFPNTINPTDLEGMQKIIAEKLNGVEELTLYVTGLSVALVEVIKFCIKNKIALDLKHYNSANGKYFTQPVTGWDTKEVRELVIEDNSIVEQKYFDF